MDCEHIYGIGPAYKEQGYYRFMYISQQDSDDEFYSEFEYCPECGVRLSWSNEEHNRQKGSNGEEGGHL